MTLNYAKDPELIKLGSKIAIVAGEGTTIPQYREYSERIICLIQDGM